MEPLTRKVARRISLTVKQARWQIAGATSNHRQTLLVAGAQRSGTNLVMDILERSYETDVYHETDQRAFDQYQMRPLPIINELRRRSRAPKFVIKALCESQHISSLLEEFAPAKAVWVIRHYHDATKSMNISFPGWILSDMRNIVRHKSAGRWVTDGMSDESYGQLRDFLNRHLDDFTNESACALQWYLRNSLYFEKDLSVNPHIRILRYESLLADPGQITGDLFAFFGLPYSANVHSMIMANSQKRGTPPRILPAVESLCANLWQRFQQLDRSAFL